MSRILIWDLPTRLFHWFFALAFTAAYVLGEEERWLGWHTYFGYLAGGLVLFRLIWGLVGGQYSRFSAFPPNPRAGARYLKSLIGGQGEHHVGHNPAGALAIYALLFLGLATAISGVAFLGADKALGPLAGVIPNRWEDVLKEVHEFCANTMLALVLLHVLGVLVGSLSHKENLPRAMVTGYRESHGRQLAGVGPAPVVALLLLAGVALFSALHDFTGGCGDNPAACTEASTHEGHEGRGRHDD